MNVPGTKVDARVIAKMKLVRSFVNVHTVSKSPTTVCHVQVRKVTKFSQYLLPTNNFFSFFHVERKITVVGLPTNR